MPKDFVYRRTPPTTPVHEPDNNFRLSPMGHLDVNNPTLPMHPGIAPENNIVDESAVGASVINSLPSQINPLLTQPVNNMLVQRHGEPILRGVDLVNGTK